MLYQYFTTRDYLHVADPTIEIMGYGGSKSACAD